MQGAHVNAQLNTAIFHVNHICILDSFWQRIYYSFQQIYGGN